MTDPANVVAGVTNGVTQNNAYQAAAANANAVATLTGVANQFTYLTEIIVVMGRAAAVGTVICAVTGLAGGTLQFDADWLTTTNSPVVIPLNPPIPCSAIGGNVVGTLPATGVSGPSASITLVGFTR